MTLIMIRLAWLQIIEVVMFEILWFLHVGMSVFQTRNLTPY